ncbi:MAG: alpha/beta hydrolase [Nitriliruptoraceae bacterium]|nr:alpha/beta hydrolase [Nitriliruptoraceae bacterium]
MRTIATPVPDRTGTHQLPDGRTLAWGAWGPTDGELVLVHNGAGMSFQLGFAPPELLEQLGIRLLAVDRPGLGGSMHDPARDHDSWARDLRAVLEAHGAERVPMLGYSQGSVFAIQCAAAGIASKLVVVAGQDDLHEVHERVGLPAPVADMLAAMTSAPDAVEANFASIASAATLLDTVTASCSPHDRAFFGEAAFAEAYESALVEGFRRGARGYARDLRLSLLPWPVAPERIDVEVELWYGALDIIPVHSPDHGATLARRFPHATRHLVADAGGSVLWREAAAILGSLRPTCS